jgi:hypothetical protein
MKTRFHRCLSAEALECRNAPAILVNPTTVTYVDVDDDLVTIKSTKGSFELADFVFLPLGGGRELLQRVELANKFEFHGAAITVTSTPSGGDGFVNVGRVNADEIDLAGLTIDGDLGRVSAGDNIHKTTGLGLLKARSIGALGVATQEPGGTLVTAVVGRLGRLDVTTNVVNAEIDVTGGQYGTVGSVTIGGTMSGNATADSGSVLASGNIGPVKIGVDLLGGPVGGTNSGRIGSNGSIASVRIGGSIVGGGDTGGGAISADGKLGPVFVGGSVLGGDGASSGSIETNLGGNIAGVTIVGSLTGGNGVNSGKISINSGGNLGPVRIGNAAALSGITGGAGTDSGSIGVQGGGNIASVTVIGDVIGSSGTNSASIRIVDAGNIGPVKITGALAGFSGPGSGSIQIQHNGSIASVTIGAGIHGNTGDESGSIQTDAIGNIGPVKIGTGLVGVGPESGLIRAMEGSIASVIVGDSVDGGSGLRSGSIIAGRDIGSVTIVGGGGDLEGGLGDESGSIISRNGDIGSVRVNGSMECANGDVISSCTIQAIRGTLRNVFIGGDVFGGSTAALESATNTGYIAGQNIGSVFIGGSILGGANSGGTLINSGAIRAAHQLKSVSIVGDVFGTATNDVIISGRGQLNPTATADVAIGTVKIGGDTAFLSILAGYTQFGTPVNPDAQIGSVSVAGNWEDGDIAAGVVSGDAFFGNAADASISGGLIVDTAIVSRIGSIVIGGTVNGTSGGVDSFGFVAEHVVSVKIGGVAIALTPGARNDLAAVSAGAMTGDVFILEVL